MRVGVMAIVNASVGIGGAIAAIINLTMLTPDFHVIDADIPLGNAIAVTVIRAVRIVRVVAITIIRIGNRIASGKHLAGGINGAI